MRDKESKKKLHESKIGKIIYGFLLFMPLFAIGVTCGYAMFNKNAYKSYSNFNTSNEQYVNVTDFNMVVGKRYRFISNNLNSTALDTNANSGKINLENFTLISQAGGVGITETNAELITGFTLYTYNSNTILQFIGGNINDIAFNTKSVTFEFTFLSFTNVDTNNSFSQYFDSMIYENEIVNTSNTLDNVFYYSVDRVTQSNLFNWVTTSNIYTGMSNFTTAMSVTNTFIPMLLTYWLIISVIYFLYDMVLVLLTILHRKIHNLQDSI